LALAALLLTGAAICAAAQNKVTARPGEADAKATPSLPPPTPKKPDEAGGVRYFYEFVQPDFIVHHIQIEHDAGGRGSISFQRRGDDESIVEPFEFSATALARVASLWAALRFLDSNADYQGQKQLPSYGTSRLRMKEGARERTAEFNYSHDRDAFQLADEYRRAAEQSVFVFEIKVAQESQPLEAPKLLNRLDTLLSRKGLSDPLQLAPLLRELSTDERLPLIARNQANRILKKLDKGSGKK
jgi:hypothetical protein